MTGNSKDCIWLARHIASKVDAALAAKGNEGWRKLASNEFRVSTAVPGCSLSLFFDKVLGKNEPPVNEIDHDDVFDIYTPGQGAAVAGTNIHELLEDLLQNEYEFAELLIERDYRVNIADVVEPVLIEELDPSEIPINSYDIRVSGHVDQGWRIEENGDMFTLDVKTVAPYIFDQIVGLKPRRKGSYAEKKIEKSRRQSNFYAGESGAEEHMILWMDRNNLRFKLDLFTVDHDEINRAIHKMGSVLHAVDKYKNGDKHARPELAGLCDCRYCEWKGVACPGEDLFRYS